ncbi:MAG: hypothetical protein WBL07_09185 [Thiothrix litoralis]|uniref:hypothetical protein n=1 Tax=Thiothrix litoralis TaxID=2891210 RepID=UPI003C72F54F
MADITPWIEHLSNPLVLVGFAVFTLAGLVKLFKPEKLSGKATEGLFHKGLNFVFVLGLLIVVLGFAKSFMQIQTADTTKSAAAPTNTQTISGNTGTAIMGGGDVNYNQGTGTLSQQNRETALPPANLQQRIENNSGTAVMSGSDANVQQKK